MNDRVELQTEVDAPRELEVLDRYEYVVRHLEAVLLRNLDLFYGIEQAAVAFADEGMEATPDSLARMAGVSRALLREGVPLTARASIAFYKTKEEVDVLARTVEKVVDIFS